MRITEKEVVETKQKLDNMIGRMTGTTSHFESTALSYLVQMSRACDRIAEVCQSEKRQKLGQV